jgi:predicted nuclease of restriction endonuclease-like (RecB) superfamily
MDKAYLLPENLENQLLDTIASLIEKGKKEVACNANSVLTMLYWNIGEHINRFIIEKKRAEYGQQIVVTLSRVLVLKYGNSFEEKNLRRMMQFAEKFSDSEIVVSLSRQLSWSHIIALIPLQSAESMLFYATKAAAEMLSVRELRKAIKGKAFERAAIANTQLPQTVTNTQNIFKDPYLLDFLGLNDDFLERDLEQAIINELEHFLLELGAGFTFVDRQKRMIIDGEDHNLDLLFYHRKLKRLIAIELKVDKFRAKYKGQMELYLKWLDKYEKEPGENSPIGIILCTETSKEQVELLEMHKDGMMVAEYWTKLPPKALFEQKINQALAEAKVRLERRKLQIDSAR